MTLIDEMAEDVRLLKQISKALGPLDLCYASLLKNLILHHCFSALIFRRIGAALERITVRPRFDIFESKLIGWLGNSCLECGKAGLALLRFQGHGRLALIGETMFRILGARARLCRPCCRIQQAFHLLFAQRLSISLAALHLVAKPICGRFLDKTTPFTAE
jgi:hypothetical protein